ncbi:DUF2946 family protein [Bradyrhizobium sp. BR13661]|jgi:hypothetical protein|uniref:DUF2946 family protein n=1 Tax=Bradyrhizobium sp. BR13661 TaxID=2940622 RepID=UPI002473FC6A|nr:DUF2946 family protein [Bradyrhizobium sp. BR13661]MDH6260792.1 hypothetical protein [Bradyrhizobium sp. BR13661]
MWQRLQGYLPIFLIALMVQVFAPITACLTIAITASDPTDFAEICRGGSPAAKKQQGDAGGQQHDRCNVCSICCLVTAGGAANSSRVIVFSATYREPAKICWLDQLSAMRSAHYHSDVQARAPPSIS